MIKENYILFSIRKLFEWLNRNCVDLIQSEWTVLFNNKTRKLHLENSNNYNRIETNQIESHNNNIATVFFHSFGCQYHGIGLPQTHCEDANSKKKNWYLQIWIVNIIIKYLSCKVTISILTIKLKCFVLFWWR